MGRTVSVPLSVPEPSQLHDREGILEETLVAVLLDPLEMRAGFVRLAFQQGIHAEICVRLCLAVVGVCRREGHRCFASVSSASASSAWCNAASARPRVRCATAFSGSRRTAV